MARYPEINLVSSGNGNPVYASLLWVKHQLMAGIGQVLPAPHNSLLVAILFGDQSGLSGCSAKDLAADPDCAKLKEKLNVAGLRHLAAVSGTHITIMAAIIAPFLVWLGFGAKGIVGDDRFCVAVRGDDRLARVGGAGGDHGKHDNSGANYWPVFGYFASGNDRRRIHGMAESFDFTFRHRFSAFVPGGFRHGLFWQTYRISIGKVH